MAAREITRQEEAMKTNREMDVKPIRLQRSRRKGAKLVSPNGLPVVCVTRGTKWGNPIKVATRAEVRAAGYFGFMLPQNPGQVVIAYERWLHETPAGLAIFDAAKRELRGKNLACWCKPGEPCHADVLLALAALSAGKAGEKE